MNLKEENEKLRELLRRVYNCVPIPDQIRIDSALCEQDSNEVASPAQDERELVAAALRACDWSSTPIGNKAIIQRACELLTRPAQKVKNVDTPEQQVVALPPYRATPDQSTFKLKADWQNQSLIDAGFNTALDEVARMNAALSAQESK